MSLKLDSLLPGTPTIPEQIANDKGPYYDALEAADIEWSKGVVNVTGLEQMLEAMLQRQLLGHPTLSENAQRQLKSTIDSRLKRAPPEILIRIFGSSTIKDQLWAVGDHLILQVGQESELDAAELRQREFGNPFPRLLAGAGASGNTVIPSDETDNLLEDREFNAGEGYAISLGRDSAIAIRKMSVEWAIESEVHNWQTESTLYIVRFGKNITFDNFYKWFDGLIARQLTMKS